MKDYPHRTRPPRAAVIAAGACLLALCCHAPAAARTRTLLGVRLGPEVSSWLSEVEGRLGREVYAEFAELDPEGAAGDYTFGTSYISAGGAAVLRVDESFRARGERETRAVLAHELLHLRLRVRGFPLFLFSPTVMTRRGPAEDVEQENVNDLVSMIEHRVFAAEMRRAGFEGLIDLTNGLGVARRAGRSPDGQAEMLNYARALLEWDDAARRDELTRIFRANGWRRSLEGGRRLADIIRGASAVKTPSGVTPVFLRCMSVLYNASFRVEPDGRFPQAKIYPQMLIYAGRGRPARR